MSEWKKVRLGDVCEIEKGSTGIASAIPGEYPLVVTAAERKTSDSYQFDCAAVCIPLVSSKGHGVKALNNVHYQEGKFALGTILCAVIPKNPEELSARYLHQYLQFNKDRVLVPLMKGAANVSLAVKDIANVEIPVPSIGNQKYFADLLNKVQLKGAEIQQEFEKQKDILKKLRQSVLQDAIEGKLTEDWRKKHPVIKGDINYDAEALYNHIQQEKRNLIAAGKIKKEKPLPEIKPEDLDFEIPESWKWVKMGELCHPITKGTTPNTSEIKQVGEIPYLKMYNIVDQKIDFDHRSQFISKDVHEKILARSKVYPNDVIMNIVGPPLGKIGIIPNEYPEWNLNQAMAIFRTYHNQMYRYVYLFLCSLVWVHKVQVLGVVGQDNVSLEECKNICIPLPPLEEQLFLTDFVNKRLLTIDELEQQIVTRETYAKTLLQTTLQTTFNS